MASINVRAWMDDRTIHFEVEPDDVIRLYVGQEKIPSDNAIVSMHYPLNALVVSLPLHRTFISETDVLYVLPEDYSIQEIVWGCEENQIKLRRWKPEAKEHDGLT